MEQVVPRGWAGVDVGKGHHWVCLIDEAGATLWSAQVVNDESAILEAIAAVLGRGEQSSDRLEDRTLIVDDLRRPQGGAGLVDQAHLSLIHISEPTRLGMISYAV